jgi:topoisomerase-4 subunit A
MGKPVDPPSPDGVESIDLKSALEERYLAYALSTIMHRALPDARDGLKPVHRRVLHAMRLLKLDPGQGYKKCARIVGDVIGKFHPHGDQAVYDALVRLAQDFAQRYLLIDGQGNFGNIDGDNAAAYRYTEARMTEVARLLLEGIDEDAVDFRETYNGEDEEPVVLPAAFPNLLANGSQGIAVGMATSIPPHNAAELCDAALYLIQHPGAPPEQLLTFVPGPARVTSVFICLGVRFCASSMIRNLFRKVRPRMNDSAFTLMRERIRSVAAARPHSPPAPLPCVSTSRLSSSAPIQGCIFSSSVPGR